MTPDEAERLANTLVSAHIWADDDGVAVRRLCEFILSGDYKREIERQAFERAAQLCERRLFGSIGIDAARHIRRELYNNLAIKLCSGQDNEQATALAERYEMALRNAAVVCEDYAKAQRVYEGPHAYAANAARACAKKILGLIPVGETNTNANAAIAPLPRGDSSKPILNEPMRETLGIACERHAARQRQKEGE